MKKKIAILGSTGSIGMSTLDVVRKNKKDFEIVLLSAKNNYKKLCQQAKEFKVKNVIIYNEFFFEKLKKLLKKNNIKVYSGKISMKKIFTKKIDYTMAAIAGIAGLQPTIDALKVSKQVAIANKESIICGWDILSKIIKKYKTKIIPVDSEHFSIMKLTENSRDKDIEEIIITASGGPFLNLNNHKLKKVKPKQAIKHPNWKMGKKISVDSANLMNKVMEVIEAYKLFSFQKKKYRIMIHPQSYVHSIVRFKNGLTKMILYNADMKIPIFNTLQINKGGISRKKINVDILNKMNFENVNLKKFPAVKLIDKCIKAGNSGPTILNASNEVLVNLFLNKKITFLDIVKNINKVFNDKDFRKYARKKAKTLKELEIIDNWARLKTLAISVR